MEPAMAFAFIFIIIVSLMIYVAVSLVQDRYRITLSASTVTASYLRAFILPRISSTSDFYLISEFFVAILSTIYFAMRYSKLPVVYYYGFRLKIHCSSVISGPLSSLLGYGLPSWLLRSRRIILSHC
jgi:hypothetical protein